MTAIIFSLFFVQLLRPVEATPCYKLKFPALTAEQIKEHKKGDLGNRKWLTPGWGSNVDYFDAHPERVTTELSPLLAKITDLFDPSVETKITNLERKIRRFVQNKSFLELPAFALRGIRYSEDSEKPTTRKSFLEKMKADGYISSDGGNFFVFYPDQGEFSPAKVEGAELIAEIFLAKVYASAGSVKRYAGGLDGTWGKDSEELSAVIFINLDSTFSIPVGRGNDGIDGTFPYSFKPFAKEFHLQNLDVGNFTRRTHPKGVPAENVKTLLLSSDLPGILKGTRDDTAQIARLREIAQTRWVYMQILRRVVAGLSR